MIRLAPLALLIACSGPAKDSGTTPVTGAGTGTGTGTGSGTGSGTGTGTGGTTSTGWVPTRYRVAYGWFGVRTNEAQPIDDVDLFGTPIQWPLQIAVRLADDTIETTLTPTNHCDVVLTSYDTVASASWTADASAWFALEMPAAAELTSANCLDLDLDASWSDVDDRIGRHRWGLFVRPLAQADLDAFGGTDPYNGGLFGGGWWTTAVSGTAGGGTAMELGVANAGSLDASGVLRREANRDWILHDASAVPISGGVEDGLYKVTAVGPWRDVSEL